MTPDEVRTTTRTFITRHMKNYEVKDEEDIFASGFVNSLFAIQLVMFVEREFQIGVEDEDLHIDNFRTINAIVNLVKRHAKELEPSAESV